jgi:hypothetical protein
MVRNYILQIKLYVEIVKSNRTIRCGKYVNIFTLNFYHKFK